MKFILFILCVFSTETFAAFELQHWTTSNGTRVVFHQTMEVPVLDVRVVFAAGSAYDDNAYGLAELTTHLLNKGSNGFDSRKIAEKFAETGAQYESKTIQEMTVLTLRTLTKSNDLAQAIDTLSMIIGHPDFTPAAFEQEKNQQLMSIAATHDSPDDLADQAFYRFLYQSHPYGHPVHGTKDTVSRLALTEVKSFYQHYFVSHNALIILVGAIEPESAHRLAEKLVHDLPNGTPAATIATAPPLNEALQVEVPYTTSQTLIRLGQTGITHHDPHYYAFQVGNYILGSPSLNSDLSRELRIKRGLTYNVFSHFSPMPGIGPFMISLATQNNQTKSALAVTQQTLADFIKKGPTDEEVKAAKQFLMGSFPVTLSNNKDIADLLARVAFFNLPDDFMTTYVDKVNAVTTNEIREAFQATIHPDKLLQVVVGPS